MYIEQYDAGCGLFIGCFDKANVCERYLKVIWLSAWRLEVPRKQVVDPVLGIRGRDGFEGGFQVGNRLYAVDVASLYQRGDAPPVLSAFAVTGEERIFLLGRGLHKRNYAHRVIMRRALREELHFLRLGWKRAAKSMASF